MSHDARDFLIGSGRVVNMRRWCVKRRRFLKAAAGSGIAALAGCSTNGDTPTENPGTSTQENTQTPGEGTPTPDGTPTDKGTPTSQQEYTDTNESSAEKERENGLLEYGASFVEINNFNNINVEGIGEEVSTEDAEATDYDALLHDFKRFWYEDNMGEDDSLIIGYKDRDSGPSEMIFQSFKNGEESSSLWQDDYRDEAITKYFDKNISGITEASDNFPDDLLALAKK